MRITAYRKIRVWLLSCLVFLAAALCAAVGVSTLKTTTANAATLSAFDYTTDGSSVRVFENSSTTEKSSRSGIRFHVQTGAGYVIPETTTTFLDTSVLSDHNGSYKVADGYTTYTLVLPTRLLGDNELSLTTDKVLKIETTGYWFSDGDDNWESVAYVYNIPEKWYTDTFAFKGIICDSEGAVVAETETSERCFVEVSKAAYKDTINTGWYEWESEARDEAAAGILKSFIPTYNITYVVDGVETTEEVLWGDTPQNVPAFTVTEDEHITYTASWYDEENSEAVDVTTAMTWTENKEITLVCASATEFILTGVSDYNNFTATDGEVYSGAKLYVTLPTSDFYTADEIASGTDRMVEVSADEDCITYEGTGTFGGLQGVWTLLEGTGIGAQMRLVLAFDSSTMEDGDKLTLKEDSVFYADNIMYKLAEEFTIDYSVVDDEEDYGVFLGYLHNSDIKKIEPWDEYNDGTRLRIRVTFHDDLLINSDFTFAFDGTLPDGYAYPVYTLCNETATATQISGGYYYWNEGANTILELDGYEEHNADELYGAPGTKIVQNGGYYIFEDAMYAYFNGSEWVVGEEMGTFGADAFVAKGKNYTTGTEEVRFTTNSNTALTAGGTTDRWFDEVRQLNVENMSKTEEYAVYATKPDGTVTPITEFVYHGQSYEDGTGYNHIFAWKNYIGTEAGETVTIIAGTRFWYGSDYYTATEDIVFYYNGSAWIAGNDGTADQEITMADFTGKNYNFFESNTNKMRMHLTADSFNAQTGALTLECGSVKVNGKAYTSLQYHGNGNMIFEIVGDSSAPIGQTTFTDTLVIEAGTRIWIGVTDGSTATPFCIEFPETLEWCYVGEGMTDGGGNPLSYEWINANANTNITRDDVLSMDNATDAGGEVRLNLASGILTNDFYGFMAVDTNNGIPVVNGVEMPNYSFAYGQSNNLVAVRGGEYGTKLGDYIVIPAGSVWWTTQGSLTFVDEIRGVWNSGEGNWHCDFNTEDELGALAADEIMRVLNDGEDEIRVMVPLGNLADSYYGAIAIDGEVYVEKANGTVVNSVFGYWYGGASGSYSAEHSLIGFRGTGIAGANDGDTFVFAAGSKIIFRTNKGVEGYYTFDEEVRYTYYTSGGWKGTNGWSVTFTLNGTTASISGTTLEDGKTVSLYEGTHTLTVTAPDGYSVTDISNATSNCDGTYTLTVSTNASVVVTTKQSVKLAADAVSSINVYAEGTLTGVRINLNETAYTGLNGISGGNYGVTMYGSTSVTSGKAASQFYTSNAYSYFGAEHGSLLELRFDTAGLVAGDTFEIAAGTVFDHSGMAYAIEFTEDIVGCWTGSAWVLNPVKKGNLDWNAIGINQILSYSDNVGASNQTYTVRIFLKSALFDDGTYQGVADNTVTIDDTVYTGIWRYHGSGNNIIEISNWSYAGGQVLVIEKGTRIYMNSSYYETTSTLTATCQADGPNAQWTWELS